jgi:ABC-2 type transport system permease protein
MKILDIAFKDLTRSFRSAFALVFMFVIPLLIPGMFSIMFNGQQETKDISIPVTSLVIANLDQGSPDLLVGFNSLPAGTVSNLTDNLGALMVGLLKSENYSNLLVISQVGDEDSARAAVDKGEVQAAVIFPPDFTKSYAVMDEPADVSFYVSDPSAEGVVITRSLLSSLIDSFSGVRIAVSVAANLSSDDGIGIVAQRYMQEQIQQNNISLVAYSTSADKPQENNILLSIIGPILGGMMIFFAFFTGTNTAQSILREDEEGTLARLFTTPTQRSDILAGKFLSVFFTVMVQVIVLLIAGQFLFHIVWGSLLKVTLIMLGIVLPATAFGICVNALLKTTKQASVIFGGLLTVTGMVGMLPVFSGGNPAPMMETIALLVPQGWAVRALIQSMNGAGFSVLLPTLLGCVGWSLVFLAIGTWRFQRRFL